MKYKNSIAFILLVMLIPSMLVLSSHNKAGSERKDHQQVSKDSLTIDKVDTLRKISNMAFTRGEYLKYEVNYGFVTAGEAILKISDTVYNNRKCHLVEFTLNSKPFFDVFYKVRDRYSTIIDSAGMFPWRFEQHIREGSYARDFVAEFDQINHVAATTNKTVSIPPYVQDIMSAFYFSRTVDFTDFKLGQKIRMQNFYKDSTYELDVKFKGRQQIKVDAGKFNCIIIEPLVKEGGLFKSEGKIYIWLTDDERRIPVMVTAKILIGNVDSELVEYHGIAGSIKAKIQ